MHEQHIHIQNQTTKRYTVYRTPYTVHPTPYTVHRGVLLCGLDGPTPDPTHLDGGLGAGVLAGVENHPFIVLDRQLPTLRVTPMIEPLLACVNFAVPNDAP